MAAAEQADDVSDIHDELDEALRAAGGKHSRMITPGQRQTISPGRWSDPT